MILRRALTLALSAVALALAAGTAAAWDLIATADDPDPAASGISMNAEGRNVSAYAIPFDTGFAVFARSRSRAGGPWGAPIRLSKVLPGRPGDIRVAVDELGRAIVIWRRAIPGSGSDLQYGLRPTADGPWELHTRGEIATVAGPGAIASPVLAFSGGRATLAWGDISAGGWQVRRATLDLVPGQPRSWTVGAPLLIGGEPVLTMDPPGDVAAIGLASGTLVVATTHAAAASGWETPVTLAPAGREATIAIADGGPLVAAWREAAPATGIVVSTRARLTEGWGAPEALAGSGFAPVAAAGPSGAAIVAYAVNLDTLDPPDPDFVFPPSDLTYPLGNIMRARRRAPTGDWGAEETVFAHYDGMRETYRKAENVRAVVDPLGTSLLAWTSIDAGLDAIWATAAAAAAPFPTARNYTAIAGPISQIALAPSGQGEAALMWRGGGSDGYASLNLQSDRVPAGSCAAPPASPPPSTPDTITLSAVQLRINQRIYSAAIRRADALDAWLGAGVATRDLCGGGIGAPALGAGVDVGAAPAPRTIPAATPRALVIRPATDKSGVVFSLSVEQLQINQRIASAAVRWANALTARLDAGLSGGDIRAGAVSADRIAATISATRAGATAPPAATRTAIAPAADKGGVTFTLSAAQLRINQRIGQAAIRRLNDVRRRLLDGISGDEMRRATITGANLAP